MVVKRQAKGQKTSPLSSVVHGYHDGQKHLERLSGCSRFLRPVSGPRLKILNVVSRDL